MTAMEAIICGMTGVGVAAAMAVGWPVGDGEDVGLEVEVGVALAIFARVALVVEVKVGSGVEVAAG